MKILPSVCAVVLAICTLLAHPAAAAEGQPVDPVPAYRAESKKQQDLLAQKLEAVTATIQEEEQAKRLTPEAAERQRSAVEGFRPQLRPPFQPPGPSNPFGSAREMPVDEKRDGAAAPALKKSWNAFTEALRTAAATYPEALRQLQAATVQYALALWRNVKTGAELTPAMEALQQAQQEGTARTEPFGIPNRPQIPEALFLMTQSQQFLAALAARDARAVSTAVGTLIGSRQNSALVSRPELDTWLQRFAAENRKDLAGYRKTLDEIIATRKTAAEASAMADQIEFALAVEKSIAGNASGMLESNFARSWAQLLAAVEAKNWAVAGPISIQMQPTAQTLSPAALAVVEEVRLQTARQLAAIQQAGRVAFAKKAAARLAQVTDGPSALALAEEFKAEAATVSKSAEMSDLPAFEADLRQLAALWNMDPTRPAGAWDPWRESVNAPEWNAALRVLRSRATRDYLARRTESPELTREPLANLPADQAVRQLGRELLTKGDWVRLHRLLSDSAPLVGQRQWNGGNEELQAVRSLMTAQNFEKAEQYPEAVQEYRNVLRQTGDLVPIDAAAERLKALRKEHPEIFNQPAAPASRPSPAKVRVIPPGAPVESGYDDGVRLSK